ncbi:hypothetical protein Q3G72_016139 [Acer saccharum]|nr:hypothetical protein Q3G72_016139 [Acer saccharum]
MAEEENLDHLLVHPRATWNYNITINTHCFHKLISDVDKILDRAGERAEFESRCFGHYLDFPKGGYFQAQFIHSLLLRQIFIPGGSEDELWFALGKPKARFGKREFCLCTGLKFGRLSDIPSREYEVVPGGVPKKLHHLARPALAQLRSAHRKMRCFRSMLVGCDSVGSQTVDFRRLALPCRSFAGKVCN